MARIAVIAAFCLLACLAASSCTANPDVASRKLMQAAASCSYTRASPGAYQDDDIIPPGTCACPAGKKAWCCQSDNSATPATCKDAAPTTCCAGAAYTYTETTGDDAGEMEALDDVWCVDAACTGTFAAAGR